LMCRFDLEAVFGLREEAEEKERTSTGEILRREDGWGGGLRGISISRGIKGTAWFRGGKVWKVAASGDCGPVAVPGFIAHTYWAGVQA